MGNYQSNLNNYFIDSQSLTWTKTYLHIGAQINAHHTESGKTALHNANLEQGQYLLQHGANPNAKDHEMRTPLITSQTPEMTQLLLEHNADPDAQDINDCTALFYASFEQATILLDHDADPLILDNYKRTPLMHPCSLEKAELLIQHKVNVKATDQNNGNALIWLAQTEPEMPSINMLLFLLDHGCDPNVVTYNNKTVFHLFKRPMAIEILLDYGANPYLRIGRKMAINQVKDPITYKIMLAHIRSDDTLDKQLILARTPQKTQKLLEQGANPNKMLRTNNSAFPVISALLLAETDVQKKILQKALQKPSNNTTGSSH